MIVGKSSKILKFVLLILYNISLMFFSLFCFCFGGGGGRVRGRVGWGKDIKCLFFPGSKTFYMYFMNEI